MHNGKRQIAFRAGQALAAFIRGGHGATQQIRGVGQGLFLGQGVVGEEGGFTGVITLSSNKKYNYLN